MLDSTSVRVHQHAVGKKAAPQPKPLDARPAWNSPGTRSAPERLLLAFRCWAGYRLQLGHAE